MSTDNYTDVLLEDMDSKFNVILGAVGSIRDEMKTLAQQNDLEEVKNDVKIVKVAVNSRRPFPPK